MYAMMSKGDSSRCGFATLLLGGVGSNAAASWFADGYGTVVIHDAGE
jgi:hypothetical protein